MTMTMNAKIDQLTVGAVSITRAELVEKMANVRNGAHSFSNQILATIPPMNKTGNPFLDRTIKLAQWGSGVNTTYATKLENKADKMGIDTTELTIEESKYTRYNGKQNCPVLRLKKDPSALYIAFFPNDQVQFVEYYVDGELATPLQAEQLKAWVKRPYASAKQTAMGIAVEEQVKIRIAKIESVVAIRIDGTLYRVV